MNFIADTNVWYNISKERINPMDFKKEGDRLLISPISFLEIASLIDKHNFEDRRRAAQAVLDYADEVITDPERHIAHLCGFQNDNIDIKWMDAFKTIARSTSPEELDKGVIDNIDNIEVLCKVKIDVLKEWREYHYKDFQQSVIQVLDERIKKYKIAIEQNKPKLKNSKDKNTFISMINTETEQERLYKGVFERIFLVLDKEYIEPTEKEMIMLKKFFTPYVKAYTEYLINCATQYKPKPNDLGDLEIFLYLQDDKKLLTSDKRWVEIAQNACPDSFMAITVNE